MGPEAKMQACDVEVAPRSPHHAAMLVLGQKIATLEECIARLGKTLEPALRPSAEVVQAATEEAVPSNVQMIAEADALCTGVGHCIARVESLSERLAI